MCVVDMKRKKKRYPNKKTLKAIREAEKGIGLTEYKDIKELFKKLGI
jgi:antitoxin component of RelBE/YafQ-DinJ toxin-antitoxin module